MNCGHDIDNFGNYPYKADVINKPWKLTCPACDMSFPTNDFASYYKSGLDANGKFQSKLANKSYLVNTLYPEKGKNWGVDDGYGYIDQSGKKYTFIAYYAHWSLWHGGIIRNALNAFTNAYMYTGEQKYADAGIVMLDRIADLYPEMNTLDMTVSNGFQHSNGGVQGKGKIVGSIWETNMVDHFISAYDALYPGFATLGEEAMNLLKTKSKGSKTKPDDLRLNIEIGILHQTYFSVLNGDIKGNSGMHQSTLTRAAVVLDDPKVTPKWLDFVFQPGDGYSTGGNVNILFVDVIDRDGFGTEASPGYNSLWLNEYLNMADILDGYVVKDTDLSYDMYTNPKFVKMFSSLFQLIVSDSQTPAIGDTGKTGHASIVAKENYLLIAYLATNDPFFAQAVYYLHKGDVSKLRLSIFDKNPEGIQDRILNVIKDHGEYKATGVNLTGYGYACLKQNMITSILDSPVTYPAVVSLEVKDLEFPGIYGGSMTVSNGIASFSPKKAGDAFLAGFYLDNDDGDYEVVFGCPENNSNGSYNVYIDGKMLQSKVDFSAKAVYFYKTAPLTKGYHYLSLEATSESELQFTTILLNKNSQSTGISSAKNPEFSFAVYYGRNTGHGHRDTLNLHLFAFNISLAPDLGYPEYADSVDMHRRWVSTTISHNTVIVNDTEQLKSVIGKTEHYDKNAYVQLSDISANVYDETSEYRRTTAMITANDSLAYYVDFFRVTGGSSHIYSFHGGEAESVETEGLNLKKQADESGNYIGTYESPYLDWGTVTDSRMAWFKNVDRDADPGNTFKVVWNLVDTYDMSKGISEKHGLKMEMTMFGDFTEVALADGIPPRNKVNNPSSVRYMMAKKTGRNLSSLFTSVIQAYSDQIIVVDSEPVKVTTENGKNADAHKVAALKVTLSTGRVDYIINSTDNSTTYTVDGLFDFCGFFGVYSVLGDKVMTYAHDATLIGKNTVQNRVNGTIVSLTKKLQLENTIVIKPANDVDVSQLTHKILSGNSLNGQNPVYEIISAKKLEDGNIELNIGSVSLINSYASATDTKNYVYNLKEGDTCYIPLTLVAGKSDAFFFPLYTSINAIILSHDISRNAKKDSLVGFLYAVDTQRTSAFDEIAYTFSLDESFGDGSLFEIRNGNELYLVKDLPDSTTYLLRLTAQSPEDTIAYTEEKSIHRMGRSESETHSIYSFRLKPNGIVPVQDSVNPPQEEKDNFNPLWYFILASGVVLIIAGAAVFWIIKKKKKA